MMNKLLTTLTFIVLLTNCQTQKQSPNIVTSDIKNFWEAYEKITSTQDSVLQYKYLDSLYLKKGTNGLKAIRQARNYTPQEYISAIKQLSEILDLGKRKHTASRPI